MGTVRLRSLHDYARWNAHLRITCNKCGRVATYSAESLIWYFREKGWNASLDIAGTRFRCDNSHGRTGCGARDVTIRAEPTGAPLPPDYPRPNQQRNVPACPAGIDADAWAKADERERKRLVQRLR
jgi:hypothetical protein